MSTFSQEEIDAAYAGVRRSNDKRSHDQQKLSHQMGTWWEGLIWLRDTLYDPAQHERTESLIKDRGAYLTGLTEDEVLRDPEEAFKRLWVASGKVMHRSLFPEQYAR